MLVERVDRLAPKEAWQRAYREIREFERVLVDDGIDLIKFVWRFHPKSSSRN